MEFNDAWTSVDTPKYEKNCDCSHGARDIAHRPLSHWDEGGVGESVNYSRHQKDTLINGKFC